MTNPFAKATKEQVKIRLAISGVSGGGKTTYALKIASYIAAQEGGRVAVLDTEGHSASQYASLFDFDVLNISNDFSPQTFIRAINAATEYGYSVLIIDSFSHAWNGAGGILEIVDKAAGNGKGNFTGWKKGRPAQDALVRAIINSNIHIIITMRAKTEWVMEPNERGKLSPKKAGVGVVQSNDLEYEMTVALLVHRNHTATVTKSRCTALNDIGEEFASSDTEIIAAALYGDSIDGEQRAAPKPETSTASAPPVETDAGQGDVPETPAPANLGLSGKHQTKRVHAVSLETVAGKTPKARRLVLTVMDSEGVEYRVSMFSRELLISAHQIGEDDHGKVGDSTPFATPFAVDLMLPDGKEYWEVARIEQAKPAPQSELDAAFPRDESGQPVMPGTPPPVPEGDVDFMHQ